MKRPDSRGPTVDAGAALVSLLVVMVILGGLVAVVLLAESGSPDSRPSIQVPQLPSVGVAPANAGPDINAAAVEACKANFQTVHEAVDAYEASNGRPPHSIADIQAMLRDPVDGVGFQITVNHTGEVEVATAGHSAVVGDTNCNYA